MMIEPSGTDRTAHVGGRLTRNNAHLSYLDGLRGLAILAVLMVHSSQLIIGLAAPLRNLAFYGVRGVQLFFIVSGLTLMMNHIGRPLDLKTFAARRFYRIAPMFYAGAILYLVLGLTTAMPSAPRNATAVQIVATFAFLHGWLPSAINKIVPGGWSIAAEAMFYLVFPILVLMARRPKRFGLWVVFSYILAGASNLLLRHLLGNSAEAKSFAMEFWLCELPAFMTGCWLAITGPSRLRSRRMGIFVMLVATIALVLDSQLRGRSNLLVAIALLSVFVWAAGRVRPAVVEHGLLPFLGRISFSLYILHFAILDVARSFASPIERMLGPGVAFVIIYLGLLGVASIAASLTYRYVEQPMIAIGRRITLVRFTTAPEIMLKDMIRKTRFR